MPKRGKEITQDIGKGVRNRKVKRIERILKYLRNNYLKEPAVLG